MNERIELVPHDPLWTSTFEIEADILREKLGNRVLRVSHVGSTAVPTIKAKPIIDIAIESKLYPPSQTIIKLLELIDYSCRGDAGVSGRVWFKKGSPRKINLHWCPENGEVAGAQIKFRDALNLNSVLAKQYEWPRLAAANGQHIDCFEYAHAKSDFVFKVVAE